MDTPPLPSPSFPAYTNHLEILRDKSESTAKVLCIIFGLLLLVGLMCTGIGLVLLLISLFVFIFKFALAARLKANGVLVTAQQWPELHQIIEQSQAKLGISGAKAYIVQDSAFNAYAMRAAGRDFVVLNSGAVDTLLRKGRIDDLRFLVGHECGHVAFGHLGFTGGFLPMFAELIFPLYAWYRRCQERSADRAGLWCAGNRVDAHRSIATLAGGAEMGSRIDINGIAAQWHEIRDEFWVRYTMFYSPYPHLCDRILLVHSAADELRLP